MGIVEESAYDEWLKNHKAMLELDYQETHKKIDEIFSKGGNLGVEQQTVEQDIKVIGEYSVEICQKEREMEAAKVYLNKLIRDFNNLKNFCFDGYKKIDEQNNNFKKYRTDPSTDQKKVAIMDALVNQSEGIANTCEQLGILFNVGADYPKDYLPNLEGIVKAYNYDRAE